MDVTAAEWGGGTRGRLKPAQPQLCFPRNQDAAPQPINKTFLGWLFGFFFGGGVGGGEDKITVGMEHGEQHPAGTEIAGTHVRLEKSGDLHRAKHAPRERRRCAKASS